VYDILPMNFRPGASGEIAERISTAFRTIADGARTELDRARRMA
jgi:hypothetical protein